MRTLKKLEKEIKEIPEGYTGNTNFLKEQMLKAQLQTLKDVVKMIDEIKLNKCYCSKLDSNSGLCGVCIISNVKEELKQKITGC